MKKKAGVKNAERSTGKATADGFGYINGKRLYTWRGQTIERSFAEAKVNHGLRFARMLGIRNMREQAFLTAAVQNIKRLAASLSLPLFLYLKTHHPKMVGLSAI